MLTEPVTRSVNGFNSRCLHVITGQDYRVTATAPEYDLLRAIRQRRLRYLRGYTDKIPLGGKPLGQNPLEQNPSRTKPLAFMTKVDKPPPPYFSLDFLAPKMVPILDII